MPIKLKLYFLENKIMLDFYPQIIAIFKQEQPLSQQVENLFCLAVLQDDPQIVITSLKSIYLYCQSKEIKEKASKILDFIDQKKLNINTLKTITKIGLVLKDGFKIDPIWREDRTMIKILLQTNALSDRFSCNEELLERKIRNLALQDDFDKIDSHLKYQKHKNLDHEEDCYQELKSKVKEPKAPNPRQITLSLDSLSKSQLTKNKKEATTQQYNKLKQLMQQHLRDKKIKIQKMDLYKKPKSASKVIAQSLLPEKKPTEPKFAIKNVASPSELQPNSRYEANFEINNMDDLKRYERQLRLQFKDDMHEFISQLCVPKFSQCDSNTQKKIISFLISQKQIELFLKINKQFNAPDLEKVKKRSELSENIPNLPKTKISKKDKVYEQRIQNIKISNAHKSLFSIKSRLQRLSLPDLVTN